MISVKVQPEFLKAEQQSEEIEGKEYEEHTIYIGNEFRIPIMPGDSGYILKEGGYFYSFDKDYETKEYVISSDKEDDVLFSIRNRNG